MQHKNILKTPIESDQDFPKFLKRVRKEQNIYLEQLAEGLMTVSQLARIEKGQRPIPKNVRDRLSGRLGIASDLYENLLNIEDYAAWERQRNILCAVERRDVRRAQELVFAYEKEEPVHDRIKKQFCLVMQAEILRQQEADWSDIAACYDAAVKCTVPDIENLHLENKLLSIQEVNIILEYEFYHKGGNFAEKCRNLAAFVENAVYDDLAKVKVYPKIVYYYLREIFSRQDDHDTESWTQILEVCNRAVELLRDTGRAFFLIELLEMKVRILDCMRAELEESRELQTEYQEGIELAGLLKKLYTEYNVPAYMQDCTYLYQQRWVFYIGDVLRIRREMYGYTQKKLCEGVCSVRTLRRAEKKEANMQQEALGTLLRKLGLSKEFQRARLVTNDREVLRLRKEMLICRNNHDFEKCRELLGHMRQMICLEIPENKQYMMDLETSLDWREGKISNEEFAAWEQKALQCTLNVPEIFRLNEIYLTELEILCIRKKIQVLDGEERKKCIEFLSYLCKLNEKKGVLSESIAMFEHVMPFIASDLGDKGEHRAAINMDDRILRESLMCRRIWVMGNTLYDILWNEMQQDTKSGLSVNKSKMTEALKQCVLFSHFCKQIFNEKFYYEKLHQS